MTFNYIDETDSTIDNQQSSKNSEVKEKGLFSKFFGGKRNNQLHTTNITGWTN